MIVCISRWQDIFSYRILACDHLSRLPAKQLPSIVPFAYLWSNSFVVGYLIFFSTNNLLRIPYALACVAAGPSTRLSHLYCSRGLKPANCLNLFECGNHNTSCWQNYKFATSPLVKDRQASPKGRAYDSTYEQETRRRPKALTRDVWV